MSTLLGFLSTDIAAVVGWIIIILIFALGMGLPQEGANLPGSKGHRKVEDDQGHEEIRGDGFIDSFSGEIEEAGGGMPLMVMIFFPGILLIWLIYLILNWAPR
jgi:p-aminobenzoyl-glutamate transporter AbgT